jgi:hypothetical protein
MHASSSAELVAEGAHSLGRVRNGLHRDPDSCHQGLKFTQGKQTVAGARFQNWLYIDNRTISLVLYLSLNNLSLSFTSFVFC